MNIVLGAIGPWAARFLIAWAMLFLVIFGFVLVVLLLGLMLSDGNVVVPPVLLPLMFPFVFALGAINAPLIWATVDSLLSVIRWYRIRAARYLFALASGIIGGFSLWYEIAHETATIARITPIYDRFVEPFLSISPGQVGPTAGVALSMQLGSFLVCISSGLAPLLAAKLMRLRQIPNRNSYGAL